MRWVVPLRCRQLAALVCHRVLLAVVGRLPQDRGDGDVARIRCQDSTAGRIEGAQHRRRREGPLERIEARLRSRGPLEPRKWKMNMLKMLIADAQLILGKCASPAANAG